MKKFTGLTITAVACAVMGLATAGFAGDTYTNNKEADFDREMHEPADLPPDAVLDNMEPGRGSGDIHHMKNETYVVPRNLEGSSAAVQGTIILVGDDMIKLVETDTGIEHEIKVTDRQEKALTTGYTINAEIKDGKLVSYTELGIPQNVQETVYSESNLPQDNILLQQPQSPYYKGQQQETPGGGIIK
jgi:hypothetical protein